MENLFVIIGFLLAMVFFVLAVIVKQGPGARNLRKAARADDTSWPKLARIIFTQRLFGFSDLGVFDNESGGREIIFFVVLLAVIVIALIWF
jgi:hypothetical protein